MRLLSGGRFCVLVPARKQEGTEISEETAAYE